MSNSPQKAPRLPHSAHTVWPGIDSLSHHGFDWVMKQTIHQFAFFNLVKPETKPEDKPEVQAVKQPRTRKPKAPKVVVLTGKISKEWRKWFKSLKPAWKPGMEAPDIEPLPEPKA